MEILLEISEEDIKTIRKLRVIACVERRFYEKKEDEEGLSDEEDKEYSDWIWRELLFNRMEALIDDKLIRQGAKDSFSVKPFKALQEELYRRTEMENRAIQLISDGKFQEATELLTSLDDNVIKELADGSTPDVSNDSSGVLSMKETECIRKVIQELTEKEHQENMECKDTLRPYVRMLAEVITSNTCLVEKDLLRFPGVVFKNKKLLPYDGSRVKVMEYRDYVAVFTQEGKYIVSLYKNRFRV